MEHVIDENSLIEMGYGYVVPATAGAKQQESRPTSDNESDGFEKKKLKKRKKKL